mmetsp:Transcript_38721/g.90230  ORF Transcript_38721/g.90230 Transcript_38721/m.90230 type:complete len:149 (-) Transcript_38721:1536-1982(-)
MFARQTVSRPNKILEIDPVDSLPGAPCPIIIIFFLNNPSISSSLLPAHFFARIRNNVIRTRRRLALLTISIRPATVTWLYSARRRAPIAITRVSIITSFPLRLISPPVTACWQLFTEALFVRMKTWRSHDISLRRTIAALPSFLLSAP